MSTRFTYAFGCLGWAWTSWAARDTGRPAWIVATCGLMSGLYLALFCAAVICATPSTTEAPDKETT